MTNNRDWLLIFEEWQKDYIIKPYAPTGPFTPWIMSAMSAFKAGWDAQEKLHSTEINSIWSSRDE